VQASSPRPVEQARALGLRPAPDWGEVEELGSHQHTAAASQGAAAEVVEAAACAHVATRANRLSDESFSS
jgi:hypothetical protein